MGKKGVTLKQISDACGLSLSTVSAALNNEDGRYSLRTVEHVRNVAAQLGYRVNQQAKILRGAKSGLLGIIKSVSLHQITSEIAVHAGETIHAEGYRFFSSDVFRHSGGLERAIDVMLDAKVEGILIENQCANAIEAVAIANVVKNGTPVVLVEGNPLEDIPHVAADHYAGFSQLAAHLIAIGHEDIVLAISETDVSGTAPSNWRTGQAIRAVKDTAYRLSVRLELALMPREGNPDFESIYFSPGRKLIQKLAGQKSRPSAVIFVNDLFAIGALRACADAGISVPDDLAIVAYDNSAVGQNAIPRLTSVDVPAAKIGREAVKLLCDIIRNKASSGEPARLLLHPEVAIRESCGSKAALPSGAALIPVS